MKVLYIFAVLVMMVMGEFQVRVYLRNTTPIIQTPTGTDMTPKTPTLATPLNEQNRKQKTPIDKTPSIPTPVDYEQY